MFHCHGGGLVSCPLDEYHFYGAMLAEQLKARVVIVDYRLAPEHCYPAAHKDCRGRLSEACSPAASTPRTWWSAGTRAGGCSGSAHCSQPATKGWLCRRASCRSRAGSTFRCPNRSTAEGPVPHGRWVRNRGHDYPGGPAGARRPPPLAGLRRPTGLPPFYLPSGQHDTLRKGREALARAALPAGVAVTIESWPGMVHGWQGLVGAGVPEAAAAFARVRGFLDDLGV